MALKIYQDEFHGGFTETVMQQVDKFNAASNGTILLNSDIAEGEYSTETFFTEVAGAISRLAPGAGGNATDLDLTDAENASVKVNRMIGPFAKFRNEWRKQARDPSMFSMIMGQQIAKAAVQEQLNTILRCLTAAIGGTVAATHSATGATINHGGVNSAIAKFGDHGGDIGLLVMHSKVYYDLIGQSITDNIYQIGGAAIVGGVPQTFNRPVLVTDSLPLLNATPSPDEYTTLGLVSGAGMVVNTEVEDLTTQEITGLAGGLKDRIQGEFAYNVGVKGYTWDVTNGGANPTDTALATSSNWDQTATDIKSTAGVALVTQ